MHWLEDNFPKCLVIFKYYWLSSKFVMQIKLLLTLFYKLIFNESNSIKSKKNFKKIKIILISQPDLMKFIKDQSKQMLIKLNQELRQFLVDQVLLKTCFIKKSAPFQKKGAFVFSVPLHTLTTHFRPRADLFTFRLFCV